TGRTDEPDGRISVRGAHVRPGVDVPVGRVHAAREHGRAAWVVDAMRAVGRAARRASADRRAVVGSGAAAPCAGLRSRDSLGRLAPCGPDRPGEGRRPDRPDAGRPSRRTSRDPDPLTRDPMTTDTRQPAEPSLEPTAPPRVPLAMRAL